MTITVRGSYTPSVGTSDSGHGSRSDGICGLNPSESEGGVMRPFGFDIREGGNKIFVDK